MTAILIFSSRGIARAINTQMNYDTIRLAVDLFLAYCHELHLRHLSHDEDGLREAVYQYLVAQKEVPGTPVFFERQQQAVFEVVEVLAHEYLHEVMGVLNEISNEYGVVRLSFHKLTPYTLQVVVNLVHVLPAPPRD